MKLLIINGPNINFLGIREPAIYGSTTYKDLCGILEPMPAPHASFSSPTMRAPSSTASSGVDGIVMNPAAYTHTSVAILDALKATAIPTVEVHISDVSTREAFRHHSYVSLAAKHTIIGHGIDGYREGIEWLAREPKSREIHTNSFPCL